jgi:N-acetylglucosaminyldiphosphoundecaprenol N-acetyl-beta-D-mannosaminyltransferase
MMNWCDTGPAITVNVASRDQLLADIERRFQSGQGFSIATLNLDHTVKFRKNAAFRDAYAQHSHITADGRPIVWLSRLARQDVELVPGSELIDPLAEFAANNNVSVALLGTTAPSLEFSAQALRDKYPGLKIVAQIAPSMAFDPIGPEANTAIETIKNSGAGLVFLALGAPKQEIFAAHAQKTLNSQGFVSIGAGLDFISGTQKRAPKWVRKLAAEWLWRMLGNPRRLASRYGACLAVLPLHTMTALGSRGASK